MIQVLGAVLRGLRARALLSVGSIVLTALAVGSAVLGPVFAEAVTNSYVVTRLREAPAASTGLVRVLEADVAARPAGGPRPGRARVRRARRGPLGRGDHDDALDALQRAARCRESFRARDDVCAGLEVTGRCPSRPGEVLMLKTDAAKTGAVVGKPLEAADLRAGRASRASTPARPSTRSGSSAPTRPRSPTTCGCCPPC